MKLQILPDTFAICRLERNASIPPWASGDFVSITRTRDELSLVCAQANAPADVQCERDWRVFKIVGPLDFALTGVLASLAMPLANASISLFAISTFDTDYVLVKSDNLPKAIHVLQSADFEIINSK
jgi:hypothetical protein